MCVIDSELFLFYISGAESHRAPLWRPQAEGMYGNPERNSEEHGRRRHAGQTPVQEVRAAELSRLGLVSRDSSVQQRLEVVTSSKPTWKQAGCSALFSG